MKKIFSVLFSILIVVGGFAGPTLNILTSGDTVIGQTTVFTEAAKMLKADFPEVTLNFMKVDLSNGSAMTMDAMIAAGTAPNVYIDTMVRASKYMVPEFALPLNTYIRDLNKYQDLSMYKTNGQLLGLPVPGGAQGMLLNMDIMKEIGFTPKFDWTIDDFLYMAQKVKEKYQGKKWATGMFAANQSGDYLLHNWFPAFGVEYYKGGNYNKATIAQTGGARVYSFYQLLVKNGYVPPNSDTLTDDDYALSWSKGELAATAFFPSWIRDYIKSAIDQKLLDKQFDMMFVPFPHATGVKGTPTYQSTGVMVVHKTGTSIDTVAARFVEYLNSARIQSEWAKYQKVVPNRVDAIPSNDVWVKQVSEIVAKNGIYDCGLSDPRFTERRALQYPILQKVLTFKMTPEDAIKAYENALSAVK